MAESRPRKIDAEQNGGLKNPDSGPFGTRYGHGEPNLPDSGLNETSSSQLAPAPPPLPVLSPPEEMLPDLSRLEPSPRPSASGDPSARLRAERLRLSAGWVAGAVGLLAFALRLRAQRARRFAVPRRARREEVFGAITLACPRARAFELWADFASLPRFMPHIERVEPMGEGLHRWYGHGPDGMPFQWETEVIEAAAGERLVWRTLPGASFAHLGHVVFKDALGGRGTEVAFWLTLKRPGGGAGRAAEHLIGMTADQWVQASLLGFRALAEARKPPKNAA